MWCRVEAGGVVAWTGCLCWLFCTGRGDDAVHPEIFDHLPVVIPCVGDAEGGEGGSRLETWLRRLDDFEGVGGGQRGDGFVGEGEGSGERCRNFFFFRELLDSGNV